MDKTGLLTKAAAGLFIVLLVRCAVPASCSCPQTAEDAYGPLVGGTVIQLELAAGTVYNICKVCDTWPTCDLVAAPSATWNNTAKTVTTPAAPLGVNASDTVYICCMYNTSEVCQNVVNFTYMENPIINNITLMNSTVDGGILQIINGENLNSVACPRLIVNATVMGSPEPTTSIGDYPTMPGNATVVYLYTPNVNSSRNLPVTSDGLEVENTTFVVFVVFDNAGHNDYDIPMNVYQHPYLEPVENMVTFVANENNFITIQGTNLLGSGFTVSDVYVSVGVGTTTWTPENACTDVQLTDTTIMCQPPPMEASTIQYPPSTGANPTQPNVTVTIGKGGYQFSQYQLQYTLSQPFSIIMIVMIAVLGFVIAVSLLFVLLTCCGVGRRPATLLEALPKKYRLLTSDGAARAQDALYDDAVASSSMHRSSSAGVTGTKTATFTTKKSSSEAALSENSAGGIQVKVVRKNEFDTDGVYNEAYDSAKL